MQQHVLSVALDSSIWQCDKLLRMAEGLQSTLTGNKPIRKWNSYTKEEKLKTVCYYYGNNWNLHQTCKKFSLNSKTLLWKMRVTFERCPHHPQMEERLHMEYKEMRKKGLKVCQWQAKMSLNSHSTVLYNGVKGWWFKLSAKKTLEELESGSQFSFPQEWFKGFERRFQLSVRRVTSTCQKEPKDK